MRRKKGVQWNMASMVSGKTEDDHLKKVAAAASRSETAAADEAQAQVDRRRIALRSEVAEQPDVARGAIIDRETTALSGPNSRAAIVRNPLGAAYHASLTTGLATGMPREVAHLFAGESQARVDFGSPSRWDAPNSTVVRRAVRKRLAETAAEKRLAQVARINGRLGNTGGVIASTRVLVLLQFLMSVLVWRRHARFSHSGCVVFRFYCDLNF